MKCKWCEKDFIEEQFWFCPNCKWPSRRWNCLMTLLKVAILPLIALWFTYKFDGYQNNRDQLQSLQQRHIQLGEATGDFRKAGVEIELACIGVDSATCYIKLSNGIADIDTAFNKIGNTLSPFIAYARSHKQKQLADDIESTWLQCFQLPYHGNNNGFPVHERNWEKFRQILKTYCKDGKCDRVAGEMAERIVFEIYSGKCYENTPDEPRNLMWFSDQVYKIINNELPIKYPGERPCLK